jgi:hypothetical protein
MIMTISELIEKLQEVGDKNGYDQEVCITWNGLGLCYDINDVQTIHPVTYISSSEVICYEDIQTLAMQAVKTYSALSEDKVRALSHVICT